MTALICKTGKKAYLRTGWLSLFAGNLSNPLLAQTDCSIHWNMRPWRSSPWHKKSFISAVSFARNLRTPSWASALLSLIHTKSALLSLLLLRILTELELCSQRVIYSGATSGYPRLPKACLPTVRLKGGAWLRLFANISWLRTGGQPAVEARKKL